MTSNYLFQIFSIQDHEAGSISTFGEENFRKIHIDQPKPEMLILTNVEKKYNFNEVKENIEKRCPGHNEPLKALNQLQPDQIGIHSNVVLIVVAFKTEFEDVFNYHELLYRHTFPKMVYCGPQKKSSLDKTFSFVYFRPHTNDAELFYTCVDEVMDVYPYADGYLLISDDVLFFHWNTIFSNESLHKIWYRKEIGAATYDLETGCHSEWKLKSVSNCRKASWTPITLPKVRNGAKNALLQMKSSNVPVLNKCSKTLSGKNGGYFRVNYQWRIADTFYIPATIAKEFQLISRVFARNSLIHALAIPTITRCLEDRTGFYPMPGVNDLKSRSALGKTPWTVINSALKANMTHIHPYKLSSVVNNSKKELRNYFCDSLLPLFLSH